MRFRGTGAVIAVMLVAACAGGAAREKRGTAAKAPTTTPPADALTPSTCATSSACWVECDYGPATACTRLGRISEDRTWFSTGCVKGDNDGCERRKYVDGGTGAWKAACDKNIPEACEQLGWAHVSGQAPNADAAYGRKLCQKANQLYGEACDAGSGLDCRLLADMTAVGLGTSQDDARASKLYERACDLGDEMACTKLGSAGATPQTADKACTAGASGCNRAGLRSEFGNGIDLDPQHAAELYTKSCLDENDGEGCDLLGYAYETGIGVVRDDDKAAIYYTASCRQGYAHGCYDLARALIDGRGVTVDYLHAARLLEATCGDERDGIGCDELVMLYAEDLVEPPRSTSATSILDKRCTQQHAPSCVKLGIAYANGNGVGFDGARALEYYVKACDLSDGDGCYAAALLLDVGDIVEQNRTRAELLLGKACSLGHQPACRLHQQRYGPIKPKT